MDTWSANTTRRRHKHTHHDVGSFGSVHRDHGLRSDSTGKLGSWRERTSSTEPNGNNNSYEGLHVDGARKMKTT